MQTGTSKGMQTIEQALAELVSRGIVSQDMALSRSSRPDQLLGILQRAGIAGPETSLGGLRVAGS